MTWPRPAWRPWELLLTATACVFPLLALSSLALVDRQPVDTESLGPGLWFITVVVALHLSLVVLGYRGDQCLLPVAVLLVGVGLSFINRLVSPELAMRQVAWLAISGCAFLGTLLVMRRTTWLRRYKYSWAIAGFALVLVTFVLGQPSAPGGPRLWFNLGLFQFQPSEIWKVVLVVFFAAYLDEYGDVLARGAWRLGPLPLPPVPYLIPLLAMFGLSMALLFVQRDLGAAVLMFGVFLAMLYVASGRWLYVLGGLLAFGVAVAASYQAIDLVRQRVEIWQDPFAAAQGAGYQIVQGLLAFAAGGLFGQGFAQGAPVFVPAIHTDYMLAAIGEELGLLGAFAIVLVYVLLSYRAYHIGMSAESRFHQLLGVGLATVVSIQAIVIMAGVLKLIPLTGITLPFLSYGGSSLLTNFVILGLLLSMARRRPGPSLI